VSDERAELADAEVDALGDPDLEQELELVATIPNGTEPTTTAPPA